MDPLRAAAPISGTSEDPATCVVRRAAESDLPGLLAIYNDAVLHTTATYDYEPQSLSQRREWFARLERDGFPVLVAVDLTGRILGWSALTPYQDKCGFRFTAQDSVYVAADCRGRGLGRQLLAPLLEAARRMRLHSVVAAIDAENQPSIRLHASFGFKEVGRFPELGYKFGRWLDVVYMQWALPSP